MYKNKIILFQFSFSERLNGKSIIDQKYIRYKFKKVYDTLDTKHIFDTKKILSFLIKSKTNY